MMTIKSYYIQLSICVLFGIYIYIILKRLRSVAGRVVKWDTEAPL